MKMPKATDGKMNRPAAIERKRTSVKEAAVYRNLSELFKDGEQIEGLYTLVAGILYGRLTGCSPDPEQIFKTGLRGLAERLTGENITDPAFGAAGIECPALSEAEFDDVRRAVAGPEAFGAVRTALLDLRERKDSGSFYTPSALAGLVAEAVPSLPDGRIPEVCDPACGGGALLLAVLRELTERGKTSREVIPHLYGCDIDPDAVYAARCALIFSGTGTVYPEGLTVCDSLTEPPDERRYDLVVMNPPWLGRRASKQLAPALRDRFSRVFTDKSDCSYCFYQLAFESLRPGGTLCALGSRYFFEAGSAADLRSYLTSSFIIEEIADFYGQRVSEWPGVDPMLLTAASAGEHVRTKPARILRPASLPGGSLRAQDVAGSIENARNGVRAGTVPFTLYESRMPEPGSGATWKLSDPGQLRLSGLSGLTGGRLGDVCRSFQGVITGCDRAFVRGADDPDCRKLAAYVRPWIKNSDVLKDRIGAARKRLLYIGRDAPEDSTLVRALSPWRDRLERRRETASGRTPWYSVQWERDPELFQSMKIVWPYKSDRNAFRVDRTGAFFSADVYGMTVTDPEWDPDLLAALLNTPFYDRLFKSFGKKLGASLYEYYPNTVMRLKLPDPKALRQALNETGGPPLINGAGSGPAVPSSDMLEEAMKKLTAPRNGAGK